MIKPEDFDFHFKPDSHWQWVETIYLAFNVPQANLNGGVYILTRPMLGACMCDVTVNDRLAFLWEDQLYVDNQQHLPCPKSMSDFSLPNGVTFKVIEPLKHYKLTYQGIDDTRFDLEYFSLHAPYDINDPAMDPMAAKRQSHHGEAWDSSWSGHYDMKYRVKGEIVVRGRRYAVDCLDGGDRSWGPRVERDNSSVLYLGAGFENDFAVHLFTGHDISKTAEMGPHISGFILEDGKTYGITESRGKQEYFKAVPIGGEFEVTDVRGKKFAFTQSAVNCSYWAPYPSNTYLQTLMRVNYNGKIGYGFQQMGLSRAYLTRHREAILSRY
jgi:hypothetical protein